MEYPFITLDDGTQISHSEMLADRSVLVYIRRDALCRAVYALPAQEWREDSRTGATQHYARAGSVS